MLEGGKRDGADMKGEEGEIERGDGGDGGGKSIVSRAGRYASGSSEWPVAPLPQQWVVGGGRVY